MMIPTTIREAAERLQHELEIHVQHYGCVDDEPGTYNNDLKIVAQFILNEEDADITMHPCHRHVGNDPHCATCNPDPEWGPDSAQQQLERGPR